MKIFSRSLTFLLVISAASVSLTACSQNPQSASESSLNEEGMPRYELPAKPTEGIRDQFTAAALPDDVAQQAKIELIKQCMEKANVSFEVGMFDPPLPSVEEIIGNKALRAEDALIGGYPEPLTTVDELDVPEATRVAYFGDSSFEERVKVDDIFGGGSSYYSGTGCEAQALQELYGDIANGNRITGLSLLNELRTIVNYAKSTDDYLAISSEWQDCMEQAGFKELRDPEDALSLSESQTPEAAREIAVNDATCRESTSFQQRYDKLIDLHLTGFKSTVEPVLIEYQKIKSQALEKSRSVLGG